MVNSCVCRGLQSSAWSALPGSSLFCYPTNSEHYSAWSALPGSTLFCYPTNSEQFFLSVLLPGRAVPCALKDLCITITASCLWSCLPRDLPPCLPLCRHPLCRHPLLQTSQLPQTAQWLSGWAPDFPPHSRTHEISVLA